MNDPQTAQESLQYLRRCLAAAQAEPTTHSWSHSLKPRSASTTRRSTSRTGSVATPGT